MAMLLLLGNLALGGCKKDPTKPPPTSPEKRLVKIEESETDFTAFEYHPDGKVWKLTASYEFGTGPEVSTFEYQYSTGGKILSAKSSTGNSYNYVYSGNDVRIEFHDENNATVSYREYHFQDERLIHISSFGLTGSDAILVGKTEYQYYSDGNIKSETQYSMHGGTELTIMEKHVFQNFDNKKNPFRLPELSGLILFPFQSINNPKKELVYDRTGSLISTIENSYTYDEKGNVLRCTVSESDLGYPPDSYTLRFIYE